jgi:hypothetical protein
MILGNTFKGISDNPIVSGFEERSFGIFINYNDHLAPVYTRKVLYGT